MVQTMPQKISFHSPERHVLAGYMFKAERAKTSQNVGKSGVARPGLHNKKIISTRFVTVLYTF